MGKLYTEEQLHKLIIKYRQNLTEFSLDKPTTQHLIDELTPIQLPSEEDIYRISMGYYDNNGSNYYFKLGAEWAINEIKEGNNE